MMQTANARRVLFFLNAQKAAARDYRQARSTAERVAIAKELEAIREKLLALRTPPAAAAPLSAQVERVRCGLYRVPSTSEPGVFHTVIADPAGALHCSCLAGLHGKSCRHVAAVLERKAQAAGGTPDMGRRAA